MANKSQIKKYLESKKIETTKNLKEESVQLQQLATDKFIKTYNEKFEEIRLKTIAIASDYDNVIKEIKNNNQAKVNEYSSCPAYKYNDLIGKLPLKNMCEYYIEVIESKNIRIKYEDKIADTEREYDNLIALCGANKSVDAIKILENLGFDINEIETKQESCTTLTTNIDVNKLFIRKGQDFEREE